MKINRANWLTSLVTVALLGLGARANYLANDNFTLSVGTGVRIVTNTESAGVGQYMTIQGVVQAMNVLSGSTLTPTFGSGNVLSMGAGTNTDTYFRPFNGGALFSLNSLAVNEKLDLTFDVQFNGATVASAQNFSFGFVFFFHRLSSFFSASSNNLRSVMLRIWHWITLSEPAE